MCVHYVQWIYCDIFITLEELMDKEDEEQMLDNFVTFFIAGGRL